MWVQVGPFPYRVKLVHGHIMHQGEPCFGLCDNLQQEILISDIPPERQRLQVFFHELMHAWWYHFDVDAGDQEAVVDLVGIAMTDFVTQSLRKLDRAELQRALTPTLDLTTQPDDRSERQPTTARAKPARPTADRHPEKPPDPTPLNERVQCAGTVERNGWRVALYEPGRPPPKQRAAG
ncbi:MAG: hypothetical protein WD294_14050 [Phycisphaeraceae bacterium]